MVHLTAEKVSNRGVPVRRAAPHADISDALRLVHELLDRMADARPAIRR